MNKLKEHRLKARLSRNQLAELAGIDIRTVSNAEEGKRIQDVKAYAIAEALSQVLNTPLTMENLEIETL